MRPLLLLLAFLVGCSPAGEAESTTAETTTETIIYLSRHAEKADGEDPELLPAGQARARRLADRLAGENLSAVYATGYRRTQATAAPAAERAGVAVRTYGAGDDAGRLVEGWLRQHRGQRILVVGHSNTVPGLVNALLGEARYGDIAEDDYGRVFRVSVGADGGATVREL